MLQYINAITGVADDALRWADTYSRDTFPRRELRNCRRRLRALADGIAAGSAVAAYGESQVGKTYLISSLLSTPTQPFVIESDGRRYSYVDELNPSGGRNTKTEATGVVTRFTLRRDATDRPGWSAQGSVFDGYSEHPPHDETAPHQYPDYPDYLEQLRLSFLRNPFVRRHFRNPGQTWLSVATPNNDGSRPIIAHLDSLAPHLVDARRRHYRRQAERIAGRMLDMLNAYYTPDNPREKNERLRSIVRNLRLGLDRRVGERPETFGRILDTLMLAAEPLRDIAYRIAVLHREQPATSHALVMLRTQAGILPDDDVTTAMRKLCTYLCCDEQQLPTLLADSGLTPEQVLTPPTHIAASLPHLIARRIIEYLDTHLNGCATSLAHILPHADEVMLMLQTLARTLGLEQALAERIAHYARIFTNQEHLPAVIASYAALTLNTFLATVGDSLLTDEHRRSVALHAEACRIPLPEVDPVVPQAAEGDVAAALQAADRAQQLATAQQHTLHMLPFWRPYTLFTRRLLQGLLLVGDISAVDPEANEAMHSIITRCTV